MKVHKELGEIEEQKTRAINLILFNAPESNDKNNAERKTYDEKIVTELCGLIKVATPDIKALFRLGNPVENLEQKVDHSNLF